MFITNSNFVTSIELHDSKENKEKLKEYKEELTTLKQDSCTEIIGKIIKHYCCGS